MDNCGKAIREIQAIISQLTPDQQVNVLTNVTLATSGEVQWRVKSSLYYSHTPDLLSLLPTELQHIILRMVDGESLLYACQVSRVWNRIIKNNNVLWHEKCSHLGVNKMAKPSSLSWYCAFVLCLRQKHLISTQKMFHDMEINLQNSSKTISMIGYKGGYFVSISDVSDMKTTIKIWKLEINLPICTFSVQPTVKSFKFSPESTLICGHFNGTLTSWDISLSFLDPELDLPYVIDDDDYDAFTRLKMRFKTHTAPVYECDFAEDIDLVVSGSQNGDIKLWHLRSGEQLYGISSSSSIIQVYMVPFNNNGFYSFFAGYVSGVKKFLLPVMDDAGGGLIKDSQGNLSIEFKELPCCQDKLGEIAEIQFGADFSCIIFECTIEHDTLSNDNDYAHMCIFDTESLNILYVLKKYNHCVIVGIGYSFLLLSDYCCDVTIIETRTGFEVGVLSSPCQTLVASQVLLGDTDWLNGLKGWELDDSLNIDGECRLEENFIDKYKEKSKLDASTEYENYRGTDDFRPVLFFFQYNDEKIRALCWNSNPGKIKIKME